MQVAWTRRYLQELEATGDYIAQHNPRCIPDCQRNTLEDRTAFVEQPVHRTGRGNQRTRELVLPGTPYIVAYRVTENQVEVLFVQHGAREWPEEL